MEWLGRLESGAVLPLRVQVRNASKEPAEPDAAPAAEFYGPTGSKVLSGVPVPPADRAGAVGLFRRPLHLGDPFATAGQYSAVVRWAVAGSQRLKAFRFEVLPLGHADGAVVALAHHETPHALYLVQQTDAGLVFRGKNPRV